MERPFDFFFAPYVTLSERMHSAALHVGLTHGSAIIPRHPAPGQGVSVLLESNGHLSLDRVAIYYTTDGSSPKGARGQAQNGMAIEAQRTGEAVDDLTSLPLRLWEATIPAQEDGTLVRYCADGWSSTETDAHWEADAVDPVTNEPARARRFAYSVDRFTAPAWFGDAVIYHVMVDRFAAGQDEPPLRHDAPITGIFGGTLRGVLEKLDYLAQLGVTCLWLSPIFESPSAHGYDPASYHDVASHFGTNETLRSLISAAHERGMRVILDFVANHTSDEHPLFLEARRDHASLAARWYTFDDAHAAGYRTYAGVATMPELATHRQEVEQYLIDAAFSWLGDFGADGLRLDHMPGPSHAFWATFQRAIKSRFPDALTLGEITEKPAGIATYEGRVDAYMDFPLSGMMRRVFALRDAPLADLFMFIEERRATLPAMARAILLDNHDMHRFLWVAGGDVTRLRIAAACELTLDATPIVYYGTEVGLRQGDDAHVENAWARGAMLWGEAQDTDLLAYYRQLIALRRAHPALRRGTMRHLAVECIEEGQESGAEGQVGAYLRSWESDYVLVALNNQEHSARLRIALPDDLVRGHLGTPENALATFMPGEIQVVPGGIELTLPALGAAIVPLEPIPE